MNKQDKIQDILMEIEARHNFKKEKGQGKNKGNKKPKKNYKGK